MSYSFIKEGRNNAVVYPGTLTASGICRRSLRQHNSLEAAVQCLVRVSVVSAVQLALLCHHNDL